VNLHALGNPRISQCEANKLTNQPTHRGNGAPEQSPGVRCECGCG
jgi:hypothetical protein